MGKALPVGESDTAALLGAQFVETSGEGAALLAGNRLRQRAGLGAGGLSVALDVVQGQLGFLLAPPVESARLPAMVIIQVMGVPFSGR